MKIAKKVLSIVLSIMMVLSVFAFSTVSAASNPVLDPANYDGNYVLLWDEYTRDYNYGTGLTAAWPRQVTFNKDGWMRMQSRTPEEIAADADGHFDYQWQYAATVTPEYDAAFKAGIQGGAYDNSYFNIVVYLKDGKVVNSTGYTTGFTAELELALNFKPDFDGDGIYGEKDEGEDAVNLTKGQIFKPMANAKYIEAMIPIGDIMEWMDEGIDYKFVSYGINVQNYQLQGTKNPQGQQGIGQIDVFISPGYNGEIPGLPEGSFPSDVESLLNTNDSEFTATFNKDEFLWTSEDPEKANPEDDALTCFGLGNTQKDENGYPLLRTGVPYKTEPLSYKGPLLEVGKVTGLTASNITANSVTLSWNAAANAESYKINETAGKVQVDAVTGTSTTITGLTPGTSYTFRVRGANGTNNGAYSTTVTITTTAAVKKPSTPKISSATVSSNKVTVKWGKASNAKYYTVERKIGSGSYKAIKSLTTATSFVDTASSAGTYTYRVIAVASDKKTKSSYSSAKSVVVKPGTPKISSATVTAYNKVTVKWGKTTNAKYYNVERKIGSGSYKTIKSLTTATSFVDTTSTAGTYTYRVTAVGSDKKTKSSVSATKAVKAIGTAKPTIKKLTPASKAMTVALKAKVTNASGYEYQVATNSSFTKGKKAVKTTKLSYKVTKLTGKKKYYVRVRAYQKVGSKTYYGKWSSVKNATTKK